ncbi:unnamed protein product [Orchesella dallaii]|uniref:C2H2-type domain-containing protein n=1 Tax=Orchesella dallaii TaxID=48710 RepID=A0ABP1RZ67_9HEXA
MGKVLFEINTKGICLFCLEKKSKTSGSNGESSIIKEEQGRTCFKMLLRFLKVNILKVCHFQPSFLESMGVVDDSAEAMITQCDKCFGVTAKFYDLFQQFEIIRIQLEKCVQTLCDSITTGERNHDRVLEYKRQMRTMQGMDLINACLADNLKREILQKCSMKVDTFIPKVALTKLHIDKDNLKKSTATLTENSIDSTCSSSTSPPPVLQSTLPSETTHYPIKIDKPNSQSQLLTAVKDNSCTNSLRQPTMHIPQPIGSQHQRPELETLSNELKQKGLIQTKNPSKNKGVKRSPSPIPIAPASIDDFKITQTESLSNVEMDFEEHFSIFKVEVDDAASHDKEAVPGISPAAPNNTSTFKHNLKSAKATPVQKSPAPSYSSSTSDDDESSDLTYALASEEMVTETNDGEDGDFDCKECGNKFSTKMALIGHIAVHSRARSSMVTAAETVFKTKLALCCKLCGANFTTSHSLNRHLNSHKFKRASAKNKNNLKMIQCNVCRRNIRVKNWESHQEVHTGKAPYKCEYCDRRFRNFTQKDNHEKSQHTIEVFSNELPSGTTSKTMDKLMANIYSQFKWSVDKGIKYITCPYCPTRLVGGQRLKSRTHVIKKHLDKVLVRLKSQHESNHEVGHPLQQDATVMEDKQKITPLVMNFDVEDDDELQQPLVDPLNVYD